MVESCFDPILIVRKRDPQLADDLQDAFVALDVILVVVRRMPALSGWFAAASPGRPSMILCLWLSLVCSIDSGEVLFERAMSLSPPS